MACRIPGKTVRSAGSAECAGLSRGEARITADTNFDVCISGIMQQAPQQDRGRLMGVTLPYVVVNKLPSTKRAEIFGLVAEGVSLRAITRITGVSKNALAKLVEDAGRPFSEYQDRAFRNLTCKRLQVDEIWPFVYAKAKNVAGAKSAPEGAGDIWTWGP